MKAAKPDMNVVNEIKKNPKITHSELPTHLVGAWKGRIFLDELVHSYALFGYICCAGLAGKNTVIEGELLRQYLEEFDAKLCLRNIEDFTGIRHEGIPLFEIVGKERIASALMKLHKPTIVRDLRLCKLQ